VFKDNPEVLKMFGQKDSGENEDAEADLSFFLHSQGYSYWDAVRLSFCEVVVLIEGAALNAERQNQGR
jgi:hypothetical protein